MTCIQRETGDIEPIAPSQPQLLNKCHNFSDVIYRLILCARLSQSSSGREVRASGQSSLNKDTNHHTDLITGQHQMDNDKGINLLKNYIYRKGIKRGLTSLY